MKNNLSKTTEIILPMTFHNIKKIFINFQNPFNNLLMKLVNKLTKESKKLLQLFNKLNQFNGNLILMNI